MSRAALMCAAASAVLAGIAAVLFRLHVAQTERLRNELAAVAASVVSIQQRPGGMHVVEERTILASPDQGPGPSSDGGGKPFDEELRHQSSIVEAMPKIMSTRFNREATDRQWSFDTRSHLEEQFSRLQSPGNEITSIECKTSICRLEGSFQAQDAFNAMMHGVFGSTDREHRVVHGGAVAPVVEHMDNGKLRAIVYMVREGTFFVDMDAALSE